jgi:hypothetical protein
VRQPTVALEGSQGLRFSLWFPLSKARRVKSKSLIVKHCLEGTYIGSPGMAVTQGVGRTGAVRVPGGGTGGSQESSSASKWNRVVGSE